MKNKTFIFMSLFCISILCFIGCQDDDNETAPTNAVTTAKQYENVEAANNEINSLAEEIFTAQSGFDNANIAGSNKTFPDCISITGEIVDQNRSIVIDFGDGCEVSEGEVLSGVIRMSFGIDLDADNTVEINYALENFSYNDITISGSATSTFSLRNQDGVSTFSTTSDFSFEWADGLTATSTTNFVKETFFGNSTDSPIDFEYYSLTSGNSNTEFNNGDRYAVEITTPLRTERGCPYIVSGVMVTTQNSETITTNFGEGECDDVATQTDGDGNEITIEL